MLSSEGARKSKTRRKRNNRLDCDWKAVIDFYFCGAARAMRKTKFGRRSRNDCRRGGSGFDYRSGTCIHSIRKQYILIEFNHPNKKKSEREPKTKTIFNSVRWANAHNGREGTGATSSGNVRSNKPHEARLESLGRRSMRFRHDKMILGIFHAPSYEQILFSDERRRKRLRETIDNRIPRQLLRLRISGADNHMNDTY